MNREYFIKHVFEKQTHIDLRKFILKLDLACIILDAYCNCCFEIMNDHKKIVKI